MRPAELWASTVALRGVALLSRVVPVRRDRVVLASARADRLVGNLAHVHAAIRRERPDLRTVVLMETYSYSLAGRVAYLLRLLRGTYYLTTSATVVIDNAYLPVHVVPRRPGVRVVQVWHAAGALKKFGHDSVDDGERAEDRVLHLGYDLVVASSETTADHYATAFATPRDQVVALGSPRAEFFADAAAVAAARERVLARHPELVGRRCVLYAPTFRGRAEAKHAGPRLDGARLRELLPPDWLLALKPHPVVAEDGATRAGFEVVFDPDEDINEIFAATDVFVTDYSSALFEWAALDRPLVLHVPDLADYERSPGLYLDYRTELVGHRVEDADTLAAVLLEPGFGRDVDYSEFVRRHLGADLAGASSRVVARCIAP